MRLQFKRIEVAANKGVGFDLCRKLLSFNEADSQLVEVVIVSRNDPITGLRIFHSAKKHRLKITRGAFLRGGDPYPYLKPLQANLFLSAKPSDVLEALKLGFPAAHVSARKAHDDAHPDELRIAFDGDSVLFGDEAERVYKKKKLPGFMKNEVAKAKIPLQEGPMKPFLVALHNLQSKATEFDKIKIRTALVTARGAPAHERALKTLRAWGVSVDQAFFLDGLEKAAFLSAFEPDFFFDDQLAHIKPAQALVNSGHVPYGIANEQDKPEKIIPSNGDTIISPNRKARRKR